MKRLFCGLLLALMLPVAHAGTDGAGSPEIGSIPSATGIPFKKEEAGAAPGVGRVITITAVLLGLAVAGLYVARRYVPHLPANLPIGRDARRRIRLVETMRLGPRTSLFLVQFDDRELLLAQSGDQVALVADTRNAEKEHGSKDRDRDG